MLNKEEGQLIKRDCWKGKVTEQSPGEKNRPLYKLRYTFLKVLLCFWDVYFPAVGGMVCTPFTTLLLDHYYGPISQMNKFDFEENICNVFDIMQAVNNGSRTWILVLQSQFSLYRIASLALNLSQLLIPLSLLHKLLTWFAASPTVEKRIAAGFQPAQGLLNRGWSWCFRWLGDPSVNCGTYSGFS